MSNENIVAGFFDDRSCDLASWIFVDPGFARDAKSCGLLIGEGIPEEMTFHDMCARIILEVAKEGGPLNLVIEAPLSATFNQSGNPTGRVMELRSGFRPRYWYLGSACCVLTSTTYLLKQLTDAHRRREIRLFEGFVSFKLPGVRSSHAGDVMELRQVLFPVGGPGGNVIEPENLVFPEDRIVSAFAVAGMDYGIPPVLVPGKRYWTDHADLIPRAEAKPHPGKVYEAANIPAVAKALLAAQEMVTQRGDLVALVLSVMGKPHRLYLHSELKKKELVASLELDPKAIRASSDFTYWNFSEDSIGKCSNGGAFWKSMDEAEQELLMAVQ